MTGPGLHVDVHDGEGPHALLVHGFLSSRAQWAPNLAALSTVCRPVVVELWGHGRSPAPADDAAYTPEGYVAAFERVREAVGAERWVLVGQSLGAALTLRYALDHPDRVLAQVITNSRAAFGDESWQRQAATNAVERSQIIAERGRAGLERIPVHPVHAKRLAPEIRDVLVADAALADPEAVARTARHTSPWASVRDRAGEVRVPTLLVAGVREPAFAEPRRFIAEAVPGVEVVDLEAGHAVNLQQPEAFDAAVVDFLRRVLPPPSVR